MRNSAVLTVGLVIAFGSTLASAQGPPMMEPRVPADKLDEARALRNPLSASPETIAQGKVLYEGKGTCFNCHGTTGQGDGPGGTILTPAPRNFHHRGFWHHRTEGELFWVVKYGSPGTGMIPFGVLLSDEEIWTVLQYERSFGGTQRRGRGMGPREGRGPHRTP